MTDPPHGTCRAFLESLKHFAKVSEWSLEQSADFFDAWLKIRQDHPESAKVQEFGPLPPTVVSEPKRKQ